MSRKMSRAGTLRTVDGDQIEPVWSSDSPTFDDVVF